MQEPKLIMKKF